MKKFLVILLIFVICGCNGCKKEDESKEKKEVKKEIEKNMVALITDYESIDDKMYNGQIWKGVSEFAKKEKYNKKRYNATVENSKAAKEKAIEKAINDGADILVFDDNVYATVVGEYQSKYPDIEMLLVGFEPLSESNKVMYTNNTSSIEFKKEEVGYMTGYILVAEGYRKLGFFGSKKDDGSSAYGFGFIQGADAAAQKLRLRYSDIRMEYRYTGSYSASDSITADAKKCYTNGTQVIFCCAGNGIYSVVDAVDKLSSRKVVSGIVDLTSESKSILFAAVLNIKDAVKDVLCNYANFGEKWGSSSAGNKVKIGIKQDGVALSAVEGSWRMNRVSIEKYDQFYRNLKNSDIEIYSNRIPTTAYVSVNMKEIR